jgi:hypothetical protein
MTSPNPRLPGRLLLRIARVLFDEPTNSSLVIPAIADLQHEMRHAGSRRQRWIVRCRGYVAIVALFVLIPFAAARLSGSARLSASPEPTGGAMLMLLVTLLFAGAWPLLRWLTLGLVVGGMLFAVVLHRWNARHPGSLAAARSTPERRPEINLSSIPVGANAGGLIFAVGSIVVVLLAFPDLGWLFAAAIGAGIVLASMLFAWRARHPGGTVPENTLLSA